MNIADYSGIEILAPKRNRDSDTWLYLIQQFLRNPVSESSPYRYWQYDICKTIICHLSVNNPPSDVPEKAEYFIK